MSGYTVSQLAHDAGGSVHIVRDHLVRGLLRPVACTRAVIACSTIPPGSAVRAAFEAGIGLDALAQLCPCPFLRYRRDTRAPVLRDHSPWPAE